MITANNLLKAGFVPGDKMPLDGDDWYRGWSFKIRDHVTIYVSEENGEVIDHPELNIQLSFLPLSITSITDLLTLAKLLK